MRLFEKKEKCYGCGACENICPRLAIEMKNDEQGFRYPIINEAQCVSCGLCQRVCQIAKEKKNLVVSVGDCYGVKSIDSIRRRSSSGGIFTLLSDIILSQGGVCIGAAFDYSMKVVHRCAINDEERNLLRGSKYVQSNLQYIFDEIVQFLEMGRFVLFSGTPCQVSAIKIFIETKKVDSSRLVLVDLVCHGAPSPKVWEEYVAFLEDEFKSKLINYSFRDKKFGWKGYHIRAEFENGEIMGDNEETQSFVKLFNRDLMIRSSCYQCPYTCLRRVGDITIGDFWGIEEIDASFDDNKGISMALINTPKGKILFSSITHKSNVEIRKYDIDKLTQPNLYRPTRKCVFYKNFWTTFRKSGYKKVAQKYGGCGRGQIIYRVRDSLIYRMTLLRKERLNE